MITFADNVKLPEAIFAQHLVCLGKTGSGKSSVLRLFVEHLLDKHKRVCVVDPKGDWWGLKTSADGKGPGYPVVAFGDFKNERAGDVPINDASGKHVAELIASGNRPAVIGLRGWTQGAMTRFWIDFAQTLFARNEGEMFLVGDEFHNFAPKEWRSSKGKENPAGVGLHWANRLLSEGRGIGLVCLIASQRPQKVHNDTLTSCETLLAMRVVHPADRNAVKAWIDGNGDPAVGREVLDSLAGMPRGDAWVWSPEAGFGPSRIAFPLFSTFDSFAPPQLQKRVSAKGWADVDLDEVKEKLKAVIEEEQANDPKELRKRVRELEKELQKRLEAGGRRPEAEKTDAATIERAVAAAVEKTAKDRDRHWQAEIKRQLQFTQGLTTRLTKINQLSHLNGEAAAPDVLHPPKIEARKAAGDVTRSKEREAGASPAPSRASRHGSSLPPASSLRSKASSIEVGDEKLGPAEMAILRAFYWLRNEEANKAKVGFYSTYSPSASTFERAIATLRRLGLVTGWRITDTGEQAISEHGVEDKPSGPQLHAWLRPKLDACANALLDVLVEAGGEPLTNEEIGERSGYSIAASTFERGIGKLRKIQAAIGQQRTGGTRAAEVFFE